MAPAKNVNGGKDRKFDHKNRTAVKRKRGCSKNPGGETACRGQKAIRLSEEQTLSSKVIQERRGGGSHQKTGTEKARPEGGETKGKRYPNRSKERGESEGKIPVNPSAENSKVLRK